MDAGKCISFVHLLITWGGCKVSGMNANAGKENGNMTRNDVVNNIMANYRKYGISQEWLEDEIRSGEQQGFSYRTIYTGIRMALGNVTGQEELFTVSDMAEAFGLSEDEVIRQVEELKAELEAAGEDKEKYFKRCQPDKIQRFIIPPGGLLS